MEMPYPVSEILNTTAPPADNIFKDIEVSIGAEDMGIGVCKGVSELSAVYADFYASHGGNYCDGESSAGNCPGKYDGDSPVRRPFYDDWQYDA